MRKGKDKRNIDVQREHNKSHREWNKEYNPIRIREEIEEERKRNESMINRIIEGSKDDTRKV